jgi:hypothetical protein
MRQFPDKTKMPLSQDGSEVIRGSSMGFNLILKLWEEASLVDINPRTNAILVSVATIFRNVWDTPNIDRSKMSEWVLNDIFMLADYVDTYLHHTSMVHEMKRKLPIIIYFPKYSAIREDRRKPLTDRDKLFEEAYTAFSKRGVIDGQVVHQTPKCKVFTSIVGSAHGLPFRELAAQLRMYSTLSDVLYTPGSPSYLISHNDLDFYFLDIVRNSSILRSHTGALIGKKDLAKRIDSSGIIPFNPLTHGMFGDKVMVKRLLDIKGKKLIMDAAAKENWLIRSEGDIARSVAKILSIPLSDVMKMRIRGV